MTTGAVSAPSVSRRPPPRPRLAAAVAFWSLLLRDVTVLRKHWWEFLLRTTMQPLLLVFVFTYVLPKVRLIPDDDGTFATLLVPGIVVLAIVMQGIHWVATPLARELGLTREIDDRVLAPIPVSLVALEKIAAGALHALIAALVVFPMAVVVPATPVELQVRWPLLLIVLPTICVMAAAGGLAFGTWFEARLIPLTFSVVVLPVTFLGTIFFPWQSLDPIPWLQWAVLANPVVYMSEALRAALVGGVAHMPLTIVYSALLGFTAVFLILGIVGFRRRVQR